MNIKEKISFFLNEGEEKDRIVKKYSDGFVWIKIRPDEVKKEGKTTTERLLMFNVDQSIKDKKVTVVSLRDSNDKIHGSVLFNHNTGEVCEIRGLKEKPIAEEHIDKLLDLFNNKYINFKSLRDMELLNSGLVEIDKKLYKVNELPKNLHVKGDLELNAAYRVNYFKKNFTLPDGLKVDGSLYLNSLKAIKKLPDNLKVGGNLVISGTSITELPDNLEVGKNLHSSEVLKKIGKNVKIGGSLSLGNNIIELPEDLKVGEHILGFKGSIKKYPQFKFTRLKARKDGFGYEEVERK